ncbi:MAG: DUF4350 domain-containing protein [Brevibacterium sp.]|nr:DUF4350 domain-containing protein [Brevibacterium sp.]MDN5832548.1 DUF4350 domain-containing protein [Brevibacterium sp.]MDN5875205.1 DUF4350 domain-containing protein [Brevibacterium sp.]MDN5908234.1 DUF4350 domain-containing protein [Brevibacterium sp.]MDN6122594.1 DUF4350 domain-containing protein [Brevibacterium sp.]
MSALIDVATRGTHSSAAVPLTARLRSAGVWIVAAVAILITVIATMLMTSDREADAPLHYDSAARDGTKAMVETLRDHGVEVTTTEDFATARNASGQPETTLLIPTNTDMLSQGDVDGFRSELATHDNRLALIDPGSTVQDFTDRITVDDSISPLATPEKISHPDCQVPAAQAAGTVETGDTEYAEARKGTEGLRTCYPFTGPGVTQIDGGEVTPGSAHGQLIVDDGGGGKGDVPVTVLGNPDWVTNAGIDEEGHASLVLSQLSQTDHLVVYYPTESAEFESAPSTLDYVPSWFIAGALWLVPCVFILLLILGRRFGPLAVERLPVIVPAVETVHGRAALAARSHDRTGALHTLRTGALLRIAKRLALGPEAGHHDIIVAIANTTGRDPAQVEAVFSSAVPRTDSDLSHTVHLLTLIESEVS